MKIAMPNLTGEPVHGYGVILSEYSRALIRLHQRGLTDWTHTALHEFADFRLFFCPPKTWFFEHGRPASDLIMHTMYEGEPLPPYWVNHLNLARAIWSPSTYCKELFESEGTTVPIIVSGYGINSDHWHPDLTKAPLGTRPLRIGIASNMLVGRKNALLAIKAFYRVAPKDAVLEVKLNESQPVFLRDEHGEIPDNIRVFSENWDITTLTAWIRSLDLLIHPTTGEGFGLPVLEAMASGVVPICPSHTGLADFVDEEVAFLTESSGMEEAWSLNRLYASESKWRKIEQETVEAQIEYAATHLDEVEKKAKAGLARTEGRTWDASLLHAIEQLTPILGG